MLDSEGIGGATSREFRDHFHGNVNTEHQQIYRNLKRNIRRGLPQLDRYPPNDYDVSLLCGGPSLDAALRIPRPNRKSKRKIATVNGAYGWALEHGLRPSIYIQLDARPHNRRFVERPIRTCRYMLHSQVDPSVYDALAGHDVRIWHSVAAPERKILDKFYMRRWHNVPGGSSVGTCAIGVLYMMGVRRIRIYGMDGCYRKGEHHAYAQAENAGEQVQRLRVGRRRFTAATWMVAQMDDLIRLVPHIPDDLHLSFEGDGLIPYLVAETARRGKPPRVTLE